MEIALPPGLIVDIDRIAGDAGRAWLAELPGSIADACARWDLVVEGAPLHGARGLVLLVRRRSDHAPYALKLAFPDESTRTELRALPLWRGRGMVEVVDSLPDRGVALLERLDHTRSLANLPLDEAMAIAGSLIRTLAIATSAVIPTASERARTVANSLDARWHASGRTIPERWIDAAVENARALAARKGGLLVNWDIHHENVLAGTRLPWIAIDPMPLRGDPELALAPLFWTRCDEIDGPRHLRHLLDTACACGSLDRDLAARWLQLRLVDYWLWGLGIGLTIDPERCRRLLAWLDR